MRFDMDIQGLEKIKEQYQATLKNRRDHRPLEKDDDRQKSVMICRGSGCIASAGKTNIYDAFAEAVERHGLKDKVELVRTGCHGLCEKGPIVVIHPGATLYTHVQADDVDEIVETHLKNNQYVERLLFYDSVRGKYIPSMNDIDFYSKQTRRILQNNGLIDPMKIDEYIATGGYFALFHALNMERANIIEEVKNAGLRGRGGAGFPTGVKWGFAYKADADQKYMVCNADEGDPGAYMNRSELEGNPHAVLEGMAIGAYAIGATKGYIYVRAEYPLAVETLEQAIAQAREYGFLGQNIMGTSFDFDIELFLGSGAFVCGEETALLASIEQKRGQPRHRPPFPASKGLFGKPTVLNNVGTLCNVPLIIRNGAAWWSDVGTESTKGTKVFSLTGNINNSGLIEVAMGTTVGEIVFDIGGGIPKGKKFKAVQLGGPSGGCVPAQYLNMPIDYESLKEIDCIMGSGAMVVLDEDACMVDTARFFLEFDRDESCGQCLPCRRGLPLMINILERIVEGQGEIEDLERLNSLATTMKKTALCALGQTAASPTLSTIRHFRDEYEAHIIQKRCPAGVCASLFQTKCRNACPIHQDIPAYLALTKEGKFKEAYQVIKQTNPIPLVLGRVCNHPCQGKCERQTLDDSVAIREVKRFVADYAYHNGFVYNPPCKQKRDEAVAIVGSGPAGLGAAYDLAIEGFQVTIFEALPVAGGMLAVGIPEYRLPKKILEYEIDQIRQMGVDIQVNSPVDSLDTLFDQGYQSVFVAIGAHGERRMNLPGEDLKGVYMGTQFLSRLHKGDIPQVGNKVVVVGGGNSAVDCARVARRLGSEVRLLYRRDKCDMPAIWEDIQDAEEEGIVIDCLTQPIAFRGNGRVQEVECQKMGLGDFDASCRRKPYQKEEAPFVLEADTVIESIGQFPQSQNLLQSGLQAQKDGRLKADPYTLQTDRDGVFAGGDAVTGPRTVVEAVAAGQRAAYSIRQYLNGEDPDPVMDRQDPARYHVPFTIDEEPVEKHQVPVKKKMPDTRIQGFEEVVYTYFQEDAQEEAGRCLRCDGR
jgi:NADH-quinone oxidoreductase subunit F